MSTDTQLFALATLFGVSGVGQGLVVSQLLSIVLSLIKDEDAGAGSGVFNTVTQAGMAAGVAIIGALYRTVLGTNPDHAAFRLSAGDFDVAFAVVALAASTTMLLEWLRTTQNRKGDELPRTGAV